MYSCPQLDRFQNSFIVGLRSDYVTKAERVFACLQQTCEHSNVVYSWSPNHIIRLLTWSTHWRMHRMTR